MWNNEGVGGKDGLVQLGMLLAATELMTFGSAIANIWARPPQTAHGAAALLADAYPGRFVLGLGVGYPFQAAQIGREYGRPLATVRDYFEQMTAEQPLAQVQELSYPRILAASGPKMLALAAEIADGAMPILVPPEYTASARQVLGPDKILVVGLTAAVDEDEDRARAVARQYVSETVARPGSPYAVNLTRLGYAAEEISAPSDEVVDAITAWGNPERIAAASKSTWMQAPIMRGSPRSRLTSRLPRRTGRARSGADAASTRARRGRQLSFKAMTSGLS